MVTVYMHVVSPKLFVICVLSRRHPFFYSVCKFGTEMLSRFFSRSFQRNFFSRLMFMSVAKSVLELWHQSRN